MNLPILGETCSRSRNKGKGRKEIRSTQLKHTEQHTGRKNNRNIEAHGAYTNTIGMRAVRNYMTD